MMITFEQALKHILDNTKELSVERVFVEDAVGRTLMEDIYSRIEMPPFNKSVMDGYALKARDIKNAPVILENIGCIQAGQMFKKEIKRGECVKIMTGAALPEGADTVVKVEDTRQAAKCVEIMKSARSGESVYDRGENIKRGQRLIKKGTVISTSDISILAMTGRQHVKVIRKPNVAVLNTGGEIVPTGRRL
ncbi:MAG: molybdopterin molybdenumtransferase MoeA, partial [Candidatus Omnitrophica bacterium]|nr:molybdopterin molybdenumtransferase MoeA [Candidatus Omnitrophota bacterium]